MLGLFKKIKNSNDHGAQEKLAHSIATGIFHIQNAWAGWMNRSFEKLSVKTRMVILVFVGLFMFIWCVKLITGTQNIPEKGLLGTAPNKRANQFNVVPNDSLLMLERIYKSYKRNPAP